MGNESMANYITDTPSEIAELLAINKSLQAKLKLATEALEFYADIENWHSLTTESIKYHKIDIQDVGNGGFDNGYGTDDDNVGGKKAREALKEINKQKDEVRCE